VWKRARIDQHYGMAALAQLDRCRDPEYACADDQDSSHAAPWGVYFATFRTVSQVRVVTSLPNVFSMSAMNTAPRALGT